MPPDLKTKLAFSSSIGVGSALHSALSKFESDILGKWNLMEAFRACSKLIKRVVAASCVKAYGAHDQLAVT